ncbi:MULTISPECIES: hypothetical protein [unclassified Breznakia]|uniref:hypothetical protein n=1 Tax=unclassified Breznakia TaxID=2623764 RepID=UPI002474B0DD|nr:MULTISPECIES: hypothetical protein [unclassified Breznakia]MDH6367607.1 hypothetical protein [Breznakia sp. PH1-1]MDH6405306.1 hypothetical protein [Breznakia sp. PF1-11]MDH6412437.1 hypothetical protein [Breznakia sp. PFB1-11]MDH6415379.1 hypothetical protein [Breznakia sp. PFB1-14]MDH6417108.1 hypothetical protein [Breznakia sp. PFB1-4]
MFVRVYDKTREKYFKSEVYAIINTGWHKKQLVRVPSEDGDYLKLFDYINKEKDSTEVIINTVIPDVPEDWIIEYSTSTLDSYRNLLEPEIVFSEYNGPKWLYEDSDTLLKLLKGESIAVSNSIFENRILNSKLEGWNYIEDQKDIDKLMNETMCFHDSIIKSLNYVSGGYVSSDKSMNPLDSKRIITMLIDSQITDTIELVFEGVNTMSLRPSSDNKTGIIYEASILVKDCIVYFYDGLVLEVDPSYNYTWIASYGLRWRFV